MSSKNKKKNIPFRIDRPLFYEDNYLPPNKDGLDFTKLTEKELYEKIVHPLARNELITKYKYNPSLWLETFQNKPTFRRSLRILIGRQTVYALNKQKYVPTSLSNTNISNNVITNTELKKIAKNTIYYTDSDIPKININIDNTDIDNDDNNDDNDIDNNNDDDNDNDNDIDTKNNNDNDCNPQKIFAINADCIDVGCLLMNRGYNPVILNMANENNPGGGWERGSGAQEENIFRRSSYCASLCNTISSFNNKYLLNKKRKWRYPITEFGCIYSPNVYIFRSNEVTGYKYLINPYKLSFIAAAMYRFPKINNLRRYIDNTLIENIKKKIRSLLRVSYLNGHNCLVMSAWGCGAFKNPPEHQAELWNQVLNENEFKNVFDCIVFAVLDDHNAHKSHNPNGNYKPFADIFGENKLL